MSTSSKVRKSDYIHDLENNFFTKPRLGKLTESLEHQSQKYQEKLRLRQSLSSYKEILKSSDIKIKGGFENMYNNISHS